MEARQRVLRVLVPAVLVAAAAVLMLIRLDEPARIVFDETYYVNDARDYLSQGVEDGFAVHPPVGKWLIAGGIGVLGDDAVGWRATGALAGALSVWLVYLIARRVLRRPEPAARSRDGPIWPAALAALLLATDGMFLVQARTSMLDIYLAMFVVLGAYLLVVDHDRSLAPDRDPPAALPVPAGASGDGPQPRPGGGDATSTEPGSATAVAEPGDATGSVVIPRTHLPRRSHLARALAGVAFGLAVATKWSGVLALLAALVLVAGWELAVRRRVTGRWISDLGRGLGSVVVGLGVVPVAVYALTFVPWLVSYADSHTGKEACDEDAAPCHFGPADRLVGLVDYHAAMVDFHLRLEAEHAYRAPAYTWPVMARPVVYYYETCSEERASGVATTNDEGELEEPEPCEVAQGEAAEIIGLGNPALWWTFLPATGLLVAGLVRRDRRAAFVLALYAVQFLPWLVVSRPVFFFYTVPIVPFMALGVGYALATLDDRRRWHWFGVGIVAGAAVGFAAGVGFEALASTASTAARWLSLWGGALLGAALGTLRDRRVEAGRLVAIPRSVLVLAGSGRATSVGRWTAAVVAVAAVAMLAYFLPVWLGVPLPEDAVRDRWWFGGWV